MADYQKAADAMQDRIEAAEKALLSVLELAEKVEAHICTDAASGLEGADIYRAANAHVTRAKGHTHNALAALAMVKASATEAGNLIPDVSIRFGGK